MELKVESFGRQLLYLIRENKNSQEVISTIARENLYNVTDQSSNTLLHEACKSGNSEVAKYLIDHGSRFDVPNYLGETPLMLAAESNCEAIVQMLIEAGAIVRILDRPIKEDNYYPSWNKRNLDFLDKSIKIIEKYLPHNNKELADKILQYEWPLQHVILLRNAHVTKLIIDHKYSDSVNEKDQHGRTALELAIFSVNVENVKLLLSYNVNVNVENSLYYLYDFGKPSESAEEKFEILNILLDRVDRNTSISNDKERYDYLIYGIFANQGKEVIKVMLEHECLLFNSRLKDSAFRALATNENPGTIELLRGKKFDVNTRKNRDKETPLMVAAQRGNVRALKYLLDEGADIEAVNFLQFSPLFFAVDGFFACEEDAMECVQMLLEYGANVQSVNNYRALPTIIDAILEYETFETTGEIVLAHLALQEALGTPINPVICEKISSHDTLKTDFELRKKLLTMKIFQSTTLFDFLTETERRLERHVRNEEFVLKLPDFLKQIEKSHYFNNLLQKRIKKANLIVGMRNRAAHFICKLMEIDYSRFPGVVDDIVSYLELEDIENLIDALFKKNCVSDNFSTCN